jgi:hypothetical protein
MDPVANKAIARRYFSEMVDKRSEGCLRNCVRKIVSFTGQSFRDHQGARGMQAGVHSGCRTI